MAGETLYLNEIVHDVVEYHFMTVEGVTADELYAAISSGLAEVRGFAVVGPDGIKMADLKAYRRTPDRRLSVWIRTEDEVPQQTQAST